MKKLIFSIIMMLTLALPSMGQEVVREGNTFRSSKVSNGRQSQEEKTKYTYEDSKGNKYDIYLSGSGKAFIKKVSQKTGKEYRQYLPEVGRQINPSAYVEESKKTTSKSRK